MESIAVQLNRLRWPGTWPILLGGLLLVSAWLLLGGAQLVGWSVTTAGSAPLTLIAATAMLLLPGLALLRLLWPDSLPLMQRWPPAIGISCALPPILLLVSQPLGIHWNSGLCWGYLALSGLILIWPRSGLHEHQQPAEPDSTRPGDPAHLLLLLITGIAVMIRLYVVRDLPVGMWGDSYHHTVIAQLLVDNGGLFSSWQPYAPLTTFTYHYGFHSNVAWLSWLSGTPVTRSLLIVGQLQNALAVPLVYLLTRRLLGSNAPALWAALIVGFISPMPAFYVNWGRYTQLAGQTVLPAVCVVWMALLDKATQRKVKHLPIMRLLTLAVLVTASLILTHYRVTLLAICFILIYGSYLLVARVRTPGIAMRVAGIALITNALTILLLIPWVLRLRESMWLRLGEHFLSTNVGTNELNILPAFSEIISLHTKPLIFGLALFGILFLCRRRHWHGMVLVGWGCLVWLATNPYLIGLPGAGIISNFAMLIANYLVLAPLAGVTLDRVTTFLAETITIRPLITWGYILPGVVLLFWGMDYQRQIVDPTYQLFTPADVTAIEWIKANTSEDALFLVNSFPAYGDSLYAGSDGGWWLSFMSGRSTNLPPLLYGSEVGEEPGYQRTIHATNTLIQEYPLDSEQAAATFRSQGYTYLYDGPAASPPEEYLNPTVLSQSPWYELVYRHDGVTIWSVR